MFHSNFIKIYKKKQTTGGKQTIHDLSDVSLENRDRLICEEQYTHISHFTIPAHEAMDWLKNTSSRMSHFVDRIQSQNKTMILRLWSFQLMKHIYWYFVNNRLYISFYITCWRATCALHVPQPFIVINYWHWNLNTLFNLFIYLICCFWYQWGQTYKSGFFFVSYSRY